MQAVVSRGFASEQAVAAHRPRSEAAPRRASGSGKAPAAGGWLLARARPHRARLHARLSPAGLGLAPLAVASRPALVAARLAIGVSPAGRW